MDSATAPGTVAWCFAERRRAWEDNQLSPLAARRYPARRLVAEDDCALRTPLQAIATGSCTARRSGA